MEYAILAGLIALAMIVAVSLVSLASKDRNVTPEQQRLEDEEQIRAISKV